ncbi:hypothetical protein HanXRQr2_Chr01g0005491 [Helianthus annuus]|uniref:Uncharacterized protein n=1 Tax=Helianthus annuus TaxID=4232 RepID=A0A9K3P1V1_HELAN|nr:hypothetical protein HanXRQr2_Chr01g0005491 [Helianthus annuus]KAJ0839427.1 hypothetical protein HanPSC8_Chr14g0606681 [Helianthus annuus]KAJ0955647.1 hypothetical protein HanPSC8_Chr01g0005281 [Helianthus annuus]
MKKANRGCEREGIRGVKIGESSALRSTPTEISESPSLLEDCLDVCILSSSIHHAC